MGPKSPKSGGPSMSQSTRPVKGARFFARSEDRPRKAHPRIELLEDRTLLTTIGPFDANLTNIPIGDVQVKQTVVLKVNFTTTDPNDPLEGEPLIIQPSDGDPIEIRTYGTQQVSIDITQDDETISAVVQGGDGDEQATIQVGPMISIVSITTSDSKSLCVTYDIANNEGATSFPLDVYRSNYSTPGLGNQVLIAQETVSGDDATNGEHCIQIDPLGTPTSEFTFLQAQALRPDPTHEYVITTAGIYGTPNPGNTASGTYSSFRIWLIGAVAHGLDGDSDLAIAFPRIITAPKLDWVNTMAAQLVNFDGYDAAVPLHWEQASITPQPDEAVNAGTQLAALVQQKASNLPVGTNDVVDVNFIGYSRGAVVVSQARRGYPDRRPCHAARSVAS